MHPKLKKGNFSTHVENTIFRKRTIIFCKWGSLWEEKYTFHWTKEEGFFCCIGGMFWLHFYYSCALPWQNGLFCRQEKELFLLIWGKGTKLFDAKLFDTLCTYQTFGGRAFLSYKTLSLTRRWISCTLQFFNVAFFEISCRCVGRWMCV